MKLLLVEDNPQLNKALLTLLRRNSYVVDAAMDGEEALLLLRDYEYDAVILDIMLPKINGLEVLRRTRESGSSVPIILLTAKSSIEDKVTGLDLGADDYLPKPFSTEELLARIRALGRRKVQTYQDQAAVEYGDLKIDESKLTVSCQGKTTSLSNKEMTILLYLIKKNGQVVSVDDISAHAWDVDAYSTSENVWVFISYLRKKLEGIDSKMKIKSIRNKGYYLGENDD